MTKERKIYAAVLGVVVAGLLIDQVVLQDGATGPQAATAGLATSAPGPGGPDLSNIDDVVKKMNQAAATLSDEHTLSHRLQQFAAARKYELPRVSNAFKPDESWVAKTATKTATTAAKVIETFRAAHQLTGVMVSSQGGVAMVQTKAAGAGGAGARRTPLRVGQTIDGMTLISVTDKTATFSGSGVQLTLTLELPDAAGVSAPSSPQAPAASESAGESGKLPAGVQSLPGVFK